MHHQDFSGDSSGTGSKKMSHPPAFHHRSDSSGAIGDDNPPQAGSSSPGPHHQQPQSQAIGAQVKKKSGFQITSVTSAQINVSTNNSIADDTESYDDMDESHTEDLSSSDILDVSVSKATESGVTERSSSDETLNSLHGVDSPGQVSPNEPLHPHSIPQAHQPQASMVNGTVHHPQQLSHSHSHQHHPDIMGGAQLPLSATGGTPPVNPLASSSPIQVPTTGPGPSQSQRLSMLDNATAAGAAVQILTTVAAGTGTEMHLPGNVNITNVSAVNAPGMPPSGTTGFDSSRVAGQGASIGTGAAPVSVSQVGAQAVAAATNPQTQQTQVGAPGSRFRVVKLDTNSEPFRKGRWMCTEYYEKEIPFTAASETPKAGETVAESEQGNGGAAVASPCPIAVQPPQTLQAYQQDFTSPQPIQNPPQVLAQNPPVAQAAIHEVGVGGQHMVQQPLGAPPVSVPVAPQQVMAPGTVSQPPAALPQQMPYAVDPHQVQPPVSYSMPQLLAGLVPPGPGRQPDFIQPTAPFQTQVQPPMPHVTPGVPMMVGLGGLALPPVAVAQQLPLQGQTAPPAQAMFAPAQPQHIPVQPQQQQQQQQLHPQPPQPQAQPPATTPAAPNQPYMPLTTLRADLQPLLTFGQMSGATHAYAGVPHTGVSSLTTTQLDNAQRMLFQQSLLGLPRLGTVAGGERAGEAGSTAGALVHMGMPMETSALVAAATAGFRTHDGEDDSSSGASVVAIDNKIEQAMDLVKSHLMYAVREEVEVLKEQIKELIERNSQLEQENNLLKNLASPEQIAQFQAQIQTGGSPTGSAQPPTLGSGGTPLALPSSQNSGSSA